MNVKFILNKIREASGLIRLLKGKYTGNSKDRMVGAQSAIEALDQERQQYEKELRAARAAFPPKKNFVDKIERESTQGRDISAI